MELATNKVKSQNKQSARLVESLSAFSTTLAEEMVSDAKDKIKKEIARGKAIAIEQDLEKVLNDGIDPIAPEDRDKFNQTKEHLQTGNTVVKHAAKATIDAGGSFEDSQAVAGLEGWSLYSHTATKASIAGKNYQAWMEGEMLDDDETKVILNGQEFTPKTAKTLDQKRAAMKILRNRYLQENELLGVKRELLAEKGGYYDQVSAGHTAIMKKYDKQNRIETSFKIKKGAIQTFKANKNYEELFTSLITTDPEGDGTGMSYEDALDETDAIIKELMNTEEFTAADLKAMGDMLVTDPTTLEKRPLREVRKTRFRLLEEALADAEEANFEFSEKKKKNLFRGDVQKLIESLEKLSEDEYSSSYLRDEYQKIKNKHGKHFKSDEFDAIIKNHAEGPTYQKQLGQAEDLLKVGELTTAKLKEFDYRIQLKYQKEASLIDQATSKENKSHIKYLEGIVSFESNSSGIEKDHPSVKLMQDYVIAKYRQELGKAILAEEPNPSQFAMAQVDQWFKTEGVKRLSAKGYDVPNFPKTSDKKENLVSEEIKRQNKIINEYGSKKAGGLGNLLKPENITKLISPEDLISSAQEYADSGPWGGFTYPPEVENLYRRFGSKQNTKHKIYKAIIEGTLGIDLGDPPPSIDKLEKYTSKADQLYLGWGDYEASNRVWGYIGTQTGTPNFELIENGLGEPLFKWSEENMTSFGDSGASYDYLKSHPSVAAKFELDLESKEGIDWERFGLAIATISHRMSRDISETLRLEEITEKLEEFGEYLAPSAENSANPNVRSGKLKPKMPSNNPSLKAKTLPSGVKVLDTETDPKTDVGYLAGEQLIKTLIGAMEWTRDQVNAFSDSMLGDITEADMADYCSSRYKHEPTTENLQACMRARY
tara:strand:- start:1589 stop:4231 length:2643 start_codon:yes stop_codon:yes gene_type:complete